ncbi:unnamed protein product [Peniophora sp. CBMAI 1063]|nr:unnamed protein product [Peniophora sp. CBMAI 1063]
MRVAASAIALLSLGVQAVVAQNFTVPSTWRRPESSASGTVRIQLAQEAIAPLIPTIQSSNGTNYQLNTWESANLLAVIANNDYVSYTSTNGQLVVDSLVAFSSSHPSFYDTQVPRNVVSDSLMWGLASFYASRAYGSAQALSFARFIWSEAFQYFVNPDDAARGSMTSKSGTFSQTCAGHSTAGAVFWQASTPADYQVNGETIGAFVALSAYLCEATSNITYCDSASLSAQFMQALMYNGEYIIDTIFLDTCETSAAAWSYNTGFLLEGLAVLISTPVAGGPAKEQFGSFLQQLVASSVVYPAWTQSTGDNAGVMIENDSTPAFTNEVKGVYKTIFIRGLREVWQRSGHFADIEFANFVGAFLIVQYNALTQLASDASTTPTYYSPIWVGPPVGTLLPWGQVPAAEMLNAVVIANASSTSPASSQASASLQTSLASFTSTATAPNSSSTTTPSISQSASRGSSGPKITVAEIVLSVLGGLAVLGILIAFFYTLYRRGWSGVKQMFKNGWSNRGTAVAGSTALASDTGVNNIDAENMRQAPVFVDSAASPVSSAPRSPSVRTPPATSSTTRMPEFVQGSSRTVEPEMGEADAHGISIVSRQRLEWRGD